MLKPIIKSLLLNAGLEVRRISPPKTNNPSSKAKDFSNPFDVQKTFFKAMGIDNPTIFDVGANIGQTADEYRLRFPDSKIYCFEPFPSSVEALKEKFSDDSGIDIVSKAVADKSGVQKFYLTGFSTTHSLFPRLTRGRRYYPSSTGPRSETKVSVTSIDEFTSEKGIENIDILKFDVQGSEMLALKGASQLLEKKAVSLIYTDINFTFHYDGGVLFHELWKFLADFQYSLFDIYHLKRATNGQIRYGDAIFVSKQVRSQVIDKYPEEP